jgi:hypothetical protein
MAKNFGAALSPVYPLDHSVHNQWKSTGGHLVWIEHVAARFPQRRYFFVSPAAGAASSLTIAALMIRSS